MREDRRLDEIAARIMDLPQHSAVVAELEGLYRQCIEEREMSEEEVEVVAHQIALEICEATAAQAQRWVWPDDFTGDTIDRARCRAEIVIAALDKHRAGFGGEPVAWLHTLHMELGQTSHRLTFDEENAFGDPGRDYDPEYEVTSKPLFLSPSLQKGPQNE